MERFLTLLSACAVIMAISLGVALATVLIRHNNSQDTSKCQLIIIKTEVM